MAEPRVSQHTRAMHQTGNRSQLGSHAMQEYAQLGAVTHVDRVIAHTCADFLDRGDGRAYLAVGLHTLDSPLQLPGR